MKTGRREPNASVELRARFGTNVRAHRQGLGMTQDALARQAKVQRSYIADVERDGRNPTLCTVAILAKALGVSVRDLFS